MQLHYTQDGAIGRITMVNPPYNALINPVFADPSELQAFLADPAIKAVILSGQGRHFCSGADPQRFSDLFSDENGLQKSLDDAKKLLDIIRFAPLPIAALIRGSCLGGGLEIAQACHFRFAVGSAMFGFPETSHNLIPGMGGTVLGNSVIGRGKLIELILSARLIGAEEALQLRLVDTVCAKDTIEEETVNFLDALTCQHSGELIRTVMQSIHNGRRMTEQEALQEETRLFCMLAGKAMEGLSND